MRVCLRLTVEVDEELFAELKGIPKTEAPENIATEFELMTDARSWSVVSSELLPTFTGDKTDVIQTILARPRIGSGGGIPLTRGEVAMLFMDGYAGDDPSLLDIRSQGYGDDDDWDGLTDDNILEDENTAFVWTKWEPIELWP